MNASSTPEGPGSVSGAPNLPAGFTDMVMPALARDFQVVAVDKRGIGLTDKPQDGYDTGTLAGDLVALMEVLGHQRFAVVGHDTGLIISYALAADHPDRVERLVLVEVPEPINNRLWHIPFNRVNHELTEQLVRGREDIFYGYEFAIQGGRQLPDETLSYDFTLFSDPDVLRGSFGFYRAWDATLAQPAAGYQSMCPGGAADGPEGKRMEDAPHQSQPALPRYYAPRGGHVAR